MAWTDERVEQLKKLWAEGLSAAQIASRMGGVTRNAVIGKVHRLGLSGRATPAKPQRGRSSALYSERRESAEPSRPRARDLEPLIPEPEFAAPVVLDSGDKTTVSTIKNNMCKWPIGDPSRDDFHFCGQPTLAGKSYCAYHAHLAFQPPQRRSERPADRRPKPLPAAKRRAAS
ncbi:MAG: GcrA family cell cycle regulator [Pseudomonadota bacterium]